MHNFIMPNQLDCYINMTPVATEMFDRIFHSGFRMLGYKYLRHQKSYKYDTRVNTVPLRIDLEKFTLSKSQRIVLRRNKDLIVKTKTPKMTLAEKKMFKKHYNKVEPFGTSELWDFIPPVECLPFGKKFQIQKPTGQHIATSYIHWGKDAVSGTYCIYDPDESHQRSIGIFTMLLELEYARILGAKYYYHGYAFDIPSAMDYKFNFTALESFDWKTRTWQPIERRPARNWREDFKDMFEHEPF